MGRILSFHPLLNVLYLFYGPISVGLRPKIIIEDQAREVFAMFFPTPVVVLIVWAVFIYISLVLRKLLLEEHKNLYNTSSTSNDNIGKISVEINYHCITCGKNHNEKSCPVCGSKIKKAIF